MTSYISTLLDLIKVRVVSLSALTGAASYVLAAHRVDLSLVLVSLGLFFLAGASGAVNQIQDLAYDVRMERTRSRPLPSGRMSVAVAMAWALLFGVAGSSLLAAFGGVTPLLLGLLALLCYNALYTPLKRRTAFACVPGALIGTIPPAVGWTAAGGSLSDPRLLGFALFFFLWQVPHFWLLMLRHADDYARAGYPTLSEAVGHVRAQRIVVAWMVAAALGALLLPVFGVGAGKPFAGVLLGCSAWMILLSARFSLMPARTGLRTAFREINLYAMSVIFLAFAEGLSHVN